MAMTARCHAELTVPLPGEQAMELFTPEGERRWAEGWDPHYPDATRREEPGAVFTTAHGHHASTWIMADRAPHRIRYARVAHEATAGTITVERVESSERFTRVRVTYDLTALTPDGAAWLDAFAAGYDDYIASWEAEIARALAVTSDDR
jgi:hypothetical protein